VVSSRADQAKRSGGSNEKPLMSWCVHEYAHNTSTGVRIVQCCALLCTCQTVQVDISW